MQQERKSIIIIGAGIGGLSTGCYSQMNGYQSQIFELHEIPGGCCTAWDRKGFTFDWCISWLLGSGPGNEMYQIWMELGALQGKQIRNFEIFNSVYGKDGRVVHFYSDPDRLEQHLLDISAADRVLIKEFCNGVRKFQKCIKAYPFLKPVGLMKTFERLKMLASFLPFFNVIRKSLNTLMTDFSGKFKDPLLQEAFNFIFYEKHPNFPVLPFYFNVACHASKSAGVPEGGSLGLSYAIENRYKRLGGQVHYNSRIEKIIVENDCATGIELSDGTRHYADIIISACDGHSVLMKMLGGKYLNPVYEKLYTKTIHEPGMLFPGYFTLFLALDGDYSKELHCSTYILPDSDKDKLIGIMHPSINVQFRNVHYPELLDKGKAVIFATYFCDITPWKELNDIEEQFPKPVKNKIIHTTHVKRTRKYKEAKKAVASYMIDRIEEKHPGIKQHIRFMDISTPITQTRYTKNYNGTVLAWQPFVESGETLEEEVKRNGPGLPGLKNFYMSGVWMTTGGLIRAAAAGRHVLQFICKDDQKEFQADIDYAVYPIERISEISVSEQEELIELAEDVLNN